MEPVIVAVGTAEGKDTLCRLCGERLRPRNKVHLLRDRVRQGKEDNSMLVAFMQDKSEVAALLEHTHFHRINQHKHFRKELSESLALVQALEQTIAPLCRDWTQWHIIDLCCGKSLSAALAALCLPGCAVTCVDKCAATQLPHYTEVGLGEKAICFVQADILSREDSPQGKEDTLCHDASSCGPVKNISSSGGVALPSAGNVVTKQEACAHKGNFVKTLTKESPFFGERRHTAVLGMHCCGDLSLAVIEVFAALQADAVLLVPCCLPRKDDERFASLYTSTDQRTLLGMGSIFREKAGDVCAQNQCKLEHWPSHC